MGAMDVVPFIPLGDATMEEAVDLAKLFGARVARELNVPVFYYGRAATRPERVDLPKVREGQFEGLRDAIGKDPARAPDEGPSQIHPTAGAMAVGARPILVAYNLYLSTSDVSVAKRIAKAIRARDGGLAEVRALGFEIKERNQAQVSINMTDVRRTPLHRVFEMVRSEAERYGVEITESEVVGLVPDEALVEAAEHYLRLNRFDRHLILERRVEERLHATPAPAGAEAAAPAPFVRGSVAEFLSALSARTATPGGGSASALAGAMGCALVEMVLRYAAPAGELPADLTAAAAEFGKWRVSLTEAVDADSRSYEGVRAARAARKAHPGSAAEERGYVDALREATRVPLEAAEACARAEGRFAELRGRIKKTFASDATTAEVLLAAGKAGALANAILNLETLNEAGAPDAALAERAADLRPPR